MNKRTLLTLVGLLVCVFAWSALPTKGSMYRIKNGRSGYCLTEDFASGVLKGTSTSTSNLAQVWVWTSEGYLQNIVSQNYLQKTATTNNNTFYADSTPAVVTLTANGSNFLIKCGGYMNEDPQHNVVTWSDTSDSGNQWSCVTATVSDEALAAARAEYKQAYSAFVEELSKYFTDLSCSEIKATYSTMSDADLKAAMATDGLPENIQEIAVKVKNGWWTATDKTTYADKNKYAQDFRVHEYQPISDASTWRDQMIQSYSLCYMGNPTGIYGMKKGEVLSVFVGTDIPEDATLYLSNAKGLERVQNRTAGVKLKKGYNSITVDRDSLIYYVNYSVNTLSNGKIVKKVADFPAMKIHIEGGWLNGYYTKPDAKSSAEDTKYQYLVSQAIANMFFIVRGKTTLFAFDKSTYQNITEWKKSIYNSIDFYDNVHSWEFGLMGVTDKVAAGEFDGSPYNSGEIANITGGNAWYPTYCNNPIFCLQNEPGTNPYASYYYISMPGTGGIESSFNADRADFDVWCVGHEHGHQNQLVINLESSTESSNNLFSNLCNYLNGYRMSRGGTFSENEDYEQKGISFGKRDIGMTMRMYWNMYLYYHLVGHQKDFYPRFFQALRDDRLTLGTGTESWLKFYRIACETAGEDLTEYFRLWGFFNPCKSVEFGDYTSYTITLTQAQIDKAVAAVKKQAQEKGWKENLAIMFVEDRLQTRPRTDIWASSETNTAHKIKPDNGGTWRTDAWLQDYYGNVGDILTYAANTPGNYTYIGSGTSIKVTGEGGVGFIVRDADGNIKARSNRYEFTIPAALAASGYTVWVVNADGTTTEIKDALENGTDEQKKEALQSAIDASKSITALIDKTGKKVGYYTADQIQALVDLVTDGKAAITNGTVDKYTEIAKAINAEMLRIQLEEAIQQIRNTGLYTIQNRRTSSRYLASNTSGSLITGTSSGTNVARWSFVPVGEGTYYLQNRSNKQLLAGVTNEKGNLSGWDVSATTKAAGFVVKVKSAGNGSFYLEPTDESTCVNCDPSGNIATWSEDEGSMWNITLYTDIEEYTKTDLQNLMADADALVNDVCDYSVTEEQLPLQCTDATAPNYISTNQPDANDTTHGIDKVIDGLGTTYFYSNHSTTASSYHNLTIDLGEGNTMQNLKFYYRTASGKHTVKPASMFVHGSTTGSSWGKVATLTDLPGNTTGVQQYTSDVIKASKGYRYWRWQVTSVNGTTDATYPPFALSRFEVYNVLTSVNLKDAYAALDTKYITDVKNEEANTSEAVSGMSTLLNYYDAYVALKKVYDALQTAAAAAVPEGIETITTTQDTNHRGIYDLQGRQAKANKPGIYVINGKRVLVK